MIVNLICDKLLTPSLDGETWSRLFRHFRDATMYMSSTHQMARHPTFITILAYGEEALPYIFAEMDYADVGLTGLMVLAATIVGHSPVHPEHRGLVDLMVLDWLLWARHNGFYY